MMKHRIADADIADTVDHNNLDLSKYEYIYPGRISNCCEDPYICCCSCLCPILTTAELIKHTKPLGSCKYCGDCGVCFSCCFHTVFNLSLCGMITGYTQPLFFSYLCFCPQFLTPCEESAVLDDILGERYNYDFDRLVGNKCLGAYYISMTPCTACLLCLVMLREIKKREKHYNRCLLGPRRKLIEGKDYQKKNALQSPGRKNFYLSYCEGRDNEDRNCYERVITVARELIKLGFCIYIRSEYGDYNKNDSTALIKSDAVLVFVTQLYIENVESESDNHVKHEWNLASKKRKFFYPIVMEKELQDPSQWGSVMTAKCGGILYANYVKDSMLNNCAETILNESSWATSKFQTI